ncbi:hypothetical protein CLAIMM_06982 [Cladophialophora immunda]|nr:hypothetical protein CLAIMM_06982 [Cladophialophora immunda]
MPLNGNLESKGCGRTAESEATAAAAAVARAAAILVMVAIQDPGQEGQGHGDGNSRNEAGDGDEGEVSFPPVSSSQINEKIVRTQRTHFWGLSPGTQLRAQVRTNVSWLNTRWNLSHY